MLRRTRTLFNVLREISLDEVRDAASRNFLLVVTGLDAGARSRVVQMLSGGVSGPGSPVANCDSTHGWSQYFERASLVLFALSSGQVSQNDTALLRRIAQLGVPVLVVSLGAPALVGEGRALDELDALTGNPRYHVEVVRLPREGDDRQLIRAVLRNLEQMDIAIARQLEPFRSTVATQLINESARANAEFALMSNLPTFIPIVGNLMAASADLLVLTKNQMMLVFKIAAVYGQDIHSTRKVLTELIPVVGAGFFWRTLARELADFLPAGIGAIPKTVIAYTGTYAAGRAAQYYYRTGHRPDAEAMARFYRDALDRVKSLLPGHDEPAR